MKLEKVYCVVPQKELKEVVKKAAEAKGFDGRHAVGSDYIIFQTKLAIINNAGIDAYGTRKHAEENGYSEVSIPVFLDLLSKYQVETKIKLSSMLTATVQATAKQVVITGSGTHTIPFSVIEQLEKTLSSPEPVSSFPTGAGDYVHYLADNEELASLLFDYAKSKGIKTWLDERGSRSNVILLQWHGGQQGLCISNVSHFSHVSPSKLLTADEFLKLVQDSGPHLPAIADYQVERKGTAIKLGCQTITQGRYKELFKAVHDANS